MRSGQVALLSSLLLLSCLASKSSRLECVDERVQSLLQTAANDNAGGDGCPLAVRLDSEENVDLSKRKVRGERFLSFPKH